jgi:WD40 repeat protein
MIATASRDHTVKLWDVARKRETATLSGHSGEVWGLAFSPDGRTLASSGMDSSIRFWNIATRQQIATLKWTAPVVSVAFSPDGNMLASGSLDATVRLWRAATLAETDATAGGLQPSR